ncbi:MAG: ABC-2 transporter permease [Oscillospiraceae bacterium]|jgi:hypothetical protein|nr:ABC-2 transporter permease [Oscillospiraceae bacterium]
MAAYFNSTLFKRNLLRFWPLATICFLIPLFIFVIPEVASNTQTRDIMSLLAIYCAMIVPILSIFTAIAVFGYLHNPKAAGFVSSLPIDRKGLYITNWLSGLILMLAPALLISVFYGILLIDQPIPSGDFLRWVGVLIASHIIFYSIAVFCAFLTGNPVMQAFLYGVINFICYALYFIHMAVISMFVFGYSSFFDLYSRSIVARLTPPVAVLEMTQSMIPNMSTYSNRYWFAANMLPDIIYWLAYLVFALILIILGYFLYKRRHIEVSGEIIVHKPVRSVFKYLMGFFIGVIIAMIVTMIIASGQWEKLTKLTVIFTVTSILFGSLGCLFAEMFTKKRLRVWKTAYKGIIAFSLSVVAIMLIIRYDGTGFERRVPDQNDVVSVSITTPHLNNTYLLHRALNDSTGNDDSFLGYYDNWQISWAYREQQRTLGLPLLDDAILDEIKLRTPNFFESPEAIAVAIKMHREIVDNKWNLIESGDNSEYSWNQQYSISYTLKNGRILTRQYMLPLHQPQENNIYTLMLELHNQPEAVDKRNRFTNLPDSAILGATVITDMSIEWINPTQFFPMRTMSAGIPITSKDDLNALTDALRMDFAAGTLGQVRLFDLTYGSITHDNIATVGMISLLLDSHAAEVPSAFEKDRIYITNFEALLGLLNIIIINETHVNTARVLKELQN